MIDINASPAFFVWLLPVQEADHSPIAAGHGQEAVLAVFPGLWHDENYLDIYFQEVFYRIKMAGIAGMFRTDRNHGNLEQRK